MPLHKDGKEDDLVHPEYWDQRYALSNGEHPTHEWLRTYEALQPFFRKHIFDSQQWQFDACILHLGSGDSTLPYDLLKHGYTNHICVDFSPVAVQLMTARAPQVKWYHSDVRDMNVIETASIDIALDKSTLDAMIYGSVWNIPEEVKKNAAQYMREVHRVMKDDALFIWISFRSPVQYKPLVNQDDLWDLQTEVLSGGETTFDYYAYIMRKK